MDSPSGLCPVVLHELLRSGWFDDVEVREPIESFERVRGVPVSDLDGGFHARPVVVDGLGAAAADISDRLQDDLLGHGPLWHSRSGVETEVAARISSAPPARRLVTQAWTN